MPLELIPILVLVLVFLAATLLPVNMGALAFVAAFVVGGFFFGREVPDEVLAGFPADLFIILVGVTYLFAIAKNNGTVDWLVQAAVRLVRWPRRAHPVGDVRGHLDPHRLRRGRPGRGGDHRPGGSVLRETPRDQPGPDEPADHQRRQCGRLLADQHLRRDHQRRRGQQRAPEFPRAAVRLASYVINFVLSVVVFFMFGGRELLHRRAADPGRCRRRARRGRARRGATSTTTVLRDERRRESTSGASDGGSSAVALGRRNGASRRSRPEA